MPAGCRGGTRSGQEKKQTFGEKKKTNTTKNKSRQEKRPGLAGRSCFGHKEARGVIVRRGWRRGATSPRRCHGPGLGGADRAGPAAPARNR